MEVISTQVPVSLINVKLSTHSFYQLAGRLAGYPFVKIVWDHQLKQMHFINHQKYAFHIDYISEQILGRKPQEVDQEIDQFNRSLYHDLDRRFYLGILSLQKSDERGAEPQFLTLETVEVDTMTLPMLKDFFKQTREWIDPSLPLLFKPANHLQEDFMSKIEVSEIPRIFSHELFTQAKFILLNAGCTEGRLRVFKTFEDYKRQKNSIEWYDILVMSRVPDDIPRVSGIINAHHTTPLSHTNVLASGWKIPNCIRIGILGEIEQRGFADQWVRYEVDPKSADLALTKIARPEILSKPPSWTVQRVKLEEPEVLNTPILSLEFLRHTDRYKYGTKAANLGEIHYLLKNGSERALGFYRVKRPPRPNLISYLEKFLKVEGTSDLSGEVHKFLNRIFHTPRGIALPFSIQQSFLESSPRIQQSIGKLKMALELEAREIDSLCIEIQQLIRRTRMPDTIQNQIDLEIAKNLSGVSNFVIRSSSNAEDLDGFSAAGIYESINHVSSASKIFESIKEVWASLLSPRSVRLRHEVGISLDDCYMGVIIQEEVAAEFGGVLVTRNPLQSGDFRNVYMNVSGKSVTTVVDGSVLPIQMLFNTVEGGGRTLSLGDFTEEPSQEVVQKLQELAFAGRLLQSHFSPDYTFNQPVDIEWLAGPEGVMILQIRPFSEGH